MKFTIGISFMILSCFAVSGFCEAFNSMTKLADPVPRIRVHDAFYPHPHLRDLKAVAKRGKILVITLIVSAGLMILISTAIIRGGKEDEEKEIKNIDPTELRKRAIQAVISGGEGLANGREQALNLALSAYAEACHVKWDNRFTECPPSVTCDIGGDRVTVIISGDCRILKIHTICGVVGARAIVNAEDMTVSSSIFSVRLTKA
jgi:hypothetical protein